MPANYKYAKKEMIVLSSSAQTHAAGATNYVGPAVLVGAENGAHFPVIFSGVISQMRVRLSGAPGGAETYTLVFRVNNVSQTLTCVITGAAFVGADLVNSFPVVAGDDICVRIISSGAAAIARVIVTAEYSH